MTASRNKASRAVTAALVGVLSVGAVPMVAVAAESTGAVTLATDDAVVARATVTYWAGIQDKYVYTGRGLGPVPKSIELVNEDVEDVVGILPKANSGDRVDGAYYYYYVEVDADGKSDFGDKVSYVDEDGDVVPLVGNQVKDDSGNFVKPVSAGTYAVVVGQWTYNGTQYGQMTYVSVADTFQIVGQALDDAVLCDGEDATDTTFNYTGETGSNTVGELLERIGVAIDGHVLGDGDVELEMWEVGGKAALNDNDYIDIDETYVVKVKGAAGSRYEGQSVEREFTLGKLDLSTAVVTGRVIAVASRGQQPDKLTAAADAVASINGVVDLDWNGLNDGEKLELTFVSDPEGSQTSGGEKGVYTYTVSAGEGSKNVEGSATVEVIYANYEATVDFGNEGIEQDDGSYVVDLSADDPTYFDLSDVSASFTFNAGGSQDVPSDSVEVTVTDDEGNVVTDMTQPGTYYVRADVWYEGETTDGNDYLAAGSSVAKVVVRYDLVEDTDVFVSYRDQNVPSGEDKIGTIVDTYDGTDLSQHVSVKVIASNGTVLAEGTDYAVTYQRYQDDGRVSDVDEVVDAGYYRILIEGITFADTYEFDFFVNPVTVDTVAVDTVFTNTDEHGNVTAYLLGYTGDVIEPTFTYNGVALDPSLYQVEYVRNVDGDGKGERGDLKDVGTYVAHLTTAEGVTNYDIDADVTIVVTETGVFADVPNNEWYSESVYLAKTYGYMNGYAGGTFFGPMDQLSRADAVMVLWNMAGCPGHNGEEGSTGNAAFDLPYEDVTESAYYAEALYWATQVGIVQGDGNQLTSFRPADPVTREEFAKMLYVYEDAQGNTYDVDADEVLSAYADADTVSEWAEEYVAWLVEEGVMGQGETVNGSGNIVRCEVAAMAVRMQPDGKIDYWSDFLN